MYFKDPKTVFEVYEICNRGEGCEHCPARCDESCSSNFDLGLEVIEAAKCLFNQIDNLQEVLNDTIEERNSLIKEKEKEPFRVSIKDCSYAFGTPTTGATTTYTDAADAWAKSSTWSWSVDK